MKFLPVKTRKLQPPKDDIYEVLEKSLPALREGDVVFITSKILAIHQGRCVRIRKDELGIKDKLIKQEAEWYLKPGKNAPHPFILTIKDYVLIPSAGIDESNGDGYYTLWPNNTQKLLKEIWTFLRKKHRISKLGVVATDSHTTPLRWGTVGISTGFYGFNPLKDYRGKKDLFGRKLKYTQVNVVDPLTAMAVLMMGEGEEQTPICLLRGAKFLQFTKKDLYQKLVIDPKDDIYEPLLKKFKKIN